MTQWGHKVQEQPAIQLKPIISYPREAKVGEHYLLSIDVQLADDSPWPYQEEEFEISFILETAPFFTYEPVGEQKPGLVLHRYGGTYGAAEYMLTAAQKKVEKGKIGITLLNAWGITIAFLPLECEIKQEVLTDFDHDTKEMYREKLPPKPVKESTENPPIARYGIARYGIDHYGIVPDADGTANKDLIEAQLQLTGWNVCSYKDLKVDATQHQAIYNHPAFPEDYLLLVDGELVGIVRIRDVDEVMAGAEYPISLSSMQSQLSSSSIHVLRPILPFIYNVTLSETRFTNCLEANPRSTKVFTFHQPATLTMWLKQAPPDISTLQNKLFRTRLRHFSQYPIVGVPEPQKEMLLQLEQSLAKNDMKTLIQVPGPKDRATENYQLLMRDRIHIISAIYRLLSFGGAKHILYLVNSVEQAREIQRIFSEYILPSNGKKFTDSYKVQFLQENLSLPETDVWIATIETLYSIQANLSTHGFPFIEKPLPIQYNLTLPFETFDVIFTDELSLRTFQEWHPLIDYFDAFIIGLSSETSEDLLNFFNRNLISQRITQIPESTHFDVCVLCALAEEADAFMRVLERKEGVTFIEGFSQEKHVYHTATIQNNRGEPLKLLLSWLPRYGPMATVKYLQPLLKEFNPRFAAMTGICAGDKRKVKLGDLVVAERTFMMDTGKMIADDDGQAVHLHDTYTSGPAENVLALARRFNEWEVPAAALTRPISRRQQREWLLNSLLSTSSLNAIPMAELEMHAPEWRTIVKDLQTGPKAFLTQAGILRNKSALTNLRFGVEKFPFEDPPSPIRYIAPMASGNAVRAGNTFDEIRIPVRDTLAIDMEGAAFYEVLRGFPLINGLLVKGVSDYANSDKDDSYQEYAAELSALYMLSFIKKYVTQELMPDGTQIGVEVTAALPDRKSVDNSKALNIYFSYDVADKKDREDLEKHLVMLKRKGLIVCWHSESITGGQVAVVESIKHLQESQIILLLISLNFVNSEHYEREINLAFELHKAKKASVIPILLRPIDDWGSTPFGDLKLGDLQPLPKDRRYVYSHSQPDGTLVTVAQEIRNVVNGFHKTEE